MLKISDNVIDCGMKYTEQERKDFFDALLMYSYFKKKPKDLENHRWKGDFLFFAEDLIVGCD